MEEIYMKEEANNAFEELLYNIDIKDHEAVERMLNANPGLATYKDTHGETALHRAMAMEINPNEKASANKIVTMLLNKRCDVYAQDELKATPLYIAAFHNYLDGAKALIASIEDPIKRKAYINSADTNGVTPLHLTMFNKYSVEFIELLLENGADPNLAADELYNIEWDNDLTPLHLAASRGDLKIVTLLVPYADINKPTRNNKKASDIYQEVFGNQNGKTEEQAKAKAEFEAAVAKGQAALIANKQVAKSEEKSPSQGGMYNKHAGQTRSSSEREDSSTPESPEPAMKKVRIDSIQQSSVPSTQNIKIKT
jgi:ankyrin repeat protein